MSRPCALATLAALVVGGPACGNDASKSEARRVCVNAAGPLLECDPVPLAGAEDACWRLVQCGAIPVTNPESDPDRGFDWSACVDAIEALPDQRFELALSCIEAASCDELKSRGARARPTDPPACLEAGPL
jgi:hypothetical protein